MNSVSIWDNSSINISDIDPRHMQNIRIPIFFRERVINQFRSPQNIEYLISILKKHPEYKMLNDIQVSNDIYLFSSGEGRAYSILGSDPMAQRGMAHPGLNLWDEVRRLNKIFYEDRLSFIRKNHHLMKQKVEEYTEPYHIRAFNADSLHPKGLEHLNNTFPLYEILENQNKSAQVDDSDILIPSADAAWSSGNPDRNHMQASEEYMGGAMSHNTGGVSPLNNANGRFMRRERIPFWQKGGREGYATNIEENLGSAARELDAHVRRW